MSSQRKNLRSPAYLRFRRRLITGLFLMAALAIAVVVSQFRTTYVERELAVKLSVDEPLVKQDLLALPLREAREQFERAYLQQQLLLCNGKVGQLAKRVGMERTHLYRKLRALGVDFRQLGDD